ncbi:Endonuclease, partial [Neofusicoccum parvum]
LALAYSGHRVPGYEPCPAGVEEGRLAAVVLARPVAHALGQRAVRALLNPPRALATPAAVREAGAEGRVEALVEARTLHKEKTAEELGGCAEVVGERWGDDGGLEGVREEGGWSVEGERRVLKEGVKGLGETGLDIFCRRVQWLWEEVYPFVDGRTKGALEELGLPGEAEELRDLLEREWDGLGVKDIALKDEEEKKRRAFVIVLERAVGASLEKKVQEVVDEAARE